MGSYGLRLHGIDAAGGLVPVAADSPRLTVTTSAAEPEAGGRTSEMTVNRADLRLLGGGRLRMVRGEERADYALPQAPTADDLLHPLLAPAAALAQIWNGREAFHAGAFVTRAGAVLVLGGKEDGKSTTLAWLAAHHGVAILADDLAIIEDGHVLAGPRCIDLRAGGGIDSGAFGPTRSVRGAERARVTLGGVPARAPLAAVIRLAWGPRVRLEDVPIQARLPALIEQRMYNVRLAADPLVLLALAGLPSVRLGRPRGPQGLAEGAAALLGRFG